jgi:hypothetical protein
MKLKVYLPILGPPGAALAQAAGARDSLRPRPGSPIYLAASVHNKDGL